MSGAELTAAVTRFCRALRARGIAATSDIAIEGARALGAVDVSDRGDVYLALRAAVVSRRQDQEPFDEVFDAFWGGVALGPSGIPAPSLPTPAPRRDAPAPTAGFTLRRWLDAAEGQGDDVVPLRRASAVERDRASAIELAYADLAGIARAAATLARRLAAVPSRRWRPSRRGARIHMRRTVRQSLRTGGDATELSYRVRAMHRTRLVVLCDVSGSMELYAAFFLRVLHALQRTAARVETFVFSTRLTRVTPWLRQPRLEPVLAQLAASARDWSGGTRIGECLAAFVSRYPHLLDRRTTVIVLSDGWDAGEPETMREAMRAMHRRAGRVIWLNPLAASPGYEPRTRGLEAALPFVDLFAPLYDASSLDAVANAVGR